MQSIRVDDEVIAALSERGKFGDTFNDVVRDVLGLPRQLSEPSSLRDHHLSGLLAPILAAGLLEAGQTLTWHRRNVRETHLVTVDAHGRLQAQDGRVYRSPDQCASALAGYPCKGWHSWRDAHGTRLVALRDQALKASTQRSTPRR
jgi:hypothetical protein